MSVLAGRFITSIGEKYGSNPDTEVLCQELPGNLFFVPTEHYSS